MTRCIVCREPCDDVRCQIERYAHPVGREGRHEGACWGGRFPTEKQLEEWQERLRERAQARAKGRVEAPPVEAFPEVQLELEIA